MAGYPGADYGTINCAGVLTSRIVIPKDAIKAMLGGSAALTNVTTVVLRGGFPPALMDDKKNSVRLIVGRDPDLTSERGRALQVLQELFDWKAGLGLRDAG